MAIPHDLPKLVHEQGSVTDELLLALVEALEKHNAIQDDTIHSDIKELTAAVGELTTQVAIIGMHTRFIGSSGP
jgi:hypothetical protein